MAAGDGRATVGDVVSALGLTGCVIEEGGSLCGLPIRARGRCHKHYVSWYRATKGTVRPPALNLKSKSVVQRYEEKRERGSPDECWPWTASADDKGYGEFFVSRERGKVPAHTFAIELATGEPCPPGKEGCHRCDNPPCCNPGHLYYGTRKENVADAYARDRVPRGSERADAKLTEDGVLDIRYRFAAGESQTVLSAEYGVSTGLISNIVNGRRGMWTHVGGPIGTHGRPGRRPKTSNEEAA
jgi:hypothetical protein